MIFVEAPCETMHVPARVVIADFKQQLIKQRLQITPDANLEAARNATLICSAIQFCYGGSVVISNGQQTQRKNDDFEGDWDFSGQLVCELATISLAAFHRKISERKAGRRFGSEVHLHLHQIDVEVLQMVLRNALNEYVSTG